MDTHSGPPSIVANRSMPPGTIIPELVYGDVGTAVAWLCNTFGFQERLRIGNHRSQLVLGEASMVVVGRGGVSDFHLPEGDATHSLMVRVAGVDQHYEHTQQCGARIISPPADYPYGERQYTAEDLAGRRWTFSQSVADVDPREWGDVLFESQ
jgi:uncharacterized glyoxalase superfamily protein PhnB